jgi:hypothetical protein
MSIPIKTQLLTIITTCIQTVSGITTVKLWPENIPNDASLRPFTGLYDEVEKVKRDNLYRLAQFNLHIETWMNTKKSENYSITMEKIHADFITTFHDSKSANFQAIHSLCQSTDEVSFEKLLWSDSECAFVNVYEVRYRTLWGDAYRVS